jgi:hypothetical protein
MSEQKYLTEREVSEITGFAVQTLRNHRFQSAGIPYLVCGKRSIRYLPQDVEEFMESVRIDPQGG